MTWTKHKLTDAQLKRLAQLAAGIDHHHGTAMLALRGKGLTEETELGEYPRTCCVITDAGREALEQARRAGW